MSRPLRITDPGLWHHTMNRGRQRAKVFRADEDRTHFLTLMADCVRRWAVFPTAYCLMGSHFHVLWYDEGGRLDRAMRHVQGVYTQWFNRKYHKDGTLFRGRYKDRLVQRDRYLAEVVRYLHINPVEAGLVQTASDYPWSSHRAFLGAESPGWLHLEPVLDHVPGGPDSPDEFEEFVHERIDTQMRRALQPTRWSPMLGDEGFVKRMRDRIRQNERTNHPEVSGARCLYALELEQVIEASCLEFAITDGELTAASRGVGNSGRLLAILACKEYSGATGREIGDRFGVQPSTVSSLVRNARARVQRDEVVQSAWERIVARLHDDNTQSST